MQIFGEIGRLGAKANNIVRLEKSKFTIPKTWIIQKGYKKEIDLSKLNPYKKYIIRPSYNLEDGKGKSYAGYFTSLFPVSISEIEHHLKSNFKKIVSKKNQDQFQSIIIQEYIEAEKYGVYFSRNPNNIFKKGWYEIGITNDGITSGGEKGNIKISFLQEKELEYIGKKCENIFQFPVDIEFSLHKNTFTILQCRPITTGNNSIYTFQEIQKISGIYEKMDFDELGESSDIFSYRVLSQLFECILIGETLYFKKKLLPDYLYKKKNTKNINLQSFLNEYQKYLRQKIFYSIIRCIIPQKLDKTVLQNIFQTYSYSFLQSRKSNLDLKFSYHTNFITKKLLKIEHQKNTAFYYLEKYKKESPLNNQLKKHPSDNKPKTKLIIKNGIILNSKDREEDEYIWIYKGVINGYITDIENIKKEKGVSQILILENLDIRIYNVIEYISGVIIKEGNQLSHNAIILREYKIPSIIQYKEFDKLKIGEKLFI